ncbi:uncharacterized protein LOC126997706 isoform X2 [Eriocheir sinensis]|uniref:uncharacterized protein LOC126997706 isoform X2 n=1 Tax=Eriocheir sinensis TaxID=95602 RepID=UPI0021C7B41B|nr:uncharacterized protein LOC126997706 isoform X2 [Eriocheir sinensis]
MPPFCWSLVLLLLSPQHTLQANSNAVAEDCREYCLQCNGTGHISPTARLGTMLQVSLQVTAQGELPYATIIVKASNPPISVMVNRENITLRVNGQPAGNFSLDTPRPAFSWVNLVLARPDPKSLLVYAPEDRLSVLTANAIPGDNVFVSSQHITRLAFNCILGCLIRDQNSALVGGGGNGKGMEGEEGEGNDLLRPPFTLYLKPAPIPSYEPFRYKFAPFFVLTSSSGFEKTVNASEWEADTWHRVEVLNKTGVKKEEEKEEVKMWVPDELYRINILRFFNWTLHCPPHELKTAPGPTQGPTDNSNTRKTTPTTTQAPGGNTEGTGGGGGGGGGGRKSNSTGMPQKDVRGGAGAGEVAAWVLAGLALFVVLILALALCTKTATTHNIHSRNLEDCPPSVGVLSFNDIKTREPEESSEPGSPTLSSTPKRPLSSW